MRPQKRTSSLLQQPSALRAAIVAAVTVAVFMTVLTAALLLLGRDGEPDATVLGVESTVFTGTVDTIDTSSAEARSVQAILTAGTTAETRSAAVDTQDGLLVSPAESVAAEVSPSIVRVDVTGSAATRFGTGSYEAVGSGVIYSTDGYIITNDHVVTVDGSPAADIRVSLATGETLDASLIARDPYTDLAVLSVDATALPAARFASSADLLVGEYAIAIGSPLDYMNSVTLGIVSGIDRTLNAAEYGASSADATSLVDLIQTDAAISPGSSGGALLNSAGAVIGINVAYVPPSDTGAQDIGFAIPSDTVSQVADEMIQTGKATHAYLGVGAATLTAELQARHALSADTGVLVTSVAEGSPADSAGLRLFDIIVSLDGRPVEAQADLVLALRAKEPGQTLDIGLERSGTAQTVTATLSDLPSDWGT